MRRPSAFRPAAGRTRGGSAGRQPSAPVEARCWSRRECLPRPIRSTAPSSMSRETAGVDSAGIGRSRCTKSSTSTSRVPTGSSHSACLEMPALVQACRHLASAQLPTVGASSGNGSAVGESRRDDRRAESEAVHSAAEQAKIESPRSCPHTRRPQSSFTHRTPNEAYFTNRIPPPLPAAAQPARPSTCHGPATCSAKQLLPGGCFANKAANRAADRHDQGC